MCMCACVLPRGPQSCCILLAHPKVGDTQPSLAMVAEVQVQACAISLQENHLLSLPSTPSLPPTGAQKVVGHCLVPQLVERVKAEESHDLKGVILDSIHWCLGADTEQALHCDAMIVFTNLLSHPLPAMRSKAARNIMELRWE